MPKITRKKEINILGTEYLLTNRSRQDSDMIERNYGQTKLSMERASAVELIEKNIPDTERSKLITRIFDIDSKILEDVNEVNDLVVDQYTKNTPGRKTMIEIKDDETEYDLLFNEVLMFKNGNEYQHDKVIDIIKNLLLKLDDTKDTMRPSDFLELIEKAEKNVSSGDYKKKDLSIAEPDAEPKTHNAKESTNAPKQKN